MRLIDADALIDYIESDDSGLMSAREYQSDYIECIEKMPTVYAENMDRELNTGSLPGCDAILFSNLDKDEETIQDTMIRASRYSGVTKKDLLDAAEKGIIEVYNLGLRTMLDYLKGN